MTLQELNNNKFGLTFSTKKHPIFKSDRVLYMNDKAVGVPEVYDHNLYQQAYEHLTYLEFGFGSPIKEYEITNARNY